MPFNLKKTYHSAPNFSIPAPDANGPLQLGTIIDDPEDPTPLNPTERIPIPAEQIFRTQTPGFRTKMNSQASGKLGIFTKLLGLGDRLDTESFNPTTEQIRLAIEVPTVRAYRRANRDKEPLYLITSIKVARGASASVIQGRAFGGGVEAAVPDPATGLFQVGANAGGEMSRETEMGFDHTSDFVLGYRLSKLIMKKDGVKAKRHRRGATLVSDDAHGVVDRYGGELEVIHDFAPECLPEGSVFVDDTFTADPEICRWVLHYIK
ncbi:hypothetical protein TrVFT333_010360 [Trichoderma virens FT-333]|nr:hypothetical protein TrVFT333_010360 [Trichoderma virens FT-333]